MTSQSLPSLSTLARMKATKARDAIILDIAKEHLFLDTLETRNRDSLDFGEHSVEGIRRALVAAYEAGLAQGRKRK